MVTSFGVKTLAAELCKVSGFRKPLIKQSGTTAATLSKEIKAFNGMYDFTF